MTSLREAAGGERAEIDLRWRPVMSAASFPV
jgi:hypothetical protein